MVIIMSFRYRLIQFMSGRYGADGLFYILFAVSVVLSVINMFVRSLILQILVYAIIIYAVFRVFSRNIPARRAENDRVNGIINKLRRKSELHQQRKADKFHVYKKCPACSAVLRLPRRPGKHTTVCPKCGKQFTVRVRK